MKDNTMPDVNNTTAEITLIFSFASCFMVAEYYSASDFFSTSLMAERTAITMRRATSQLIGCLLSDMVIRQVIFKNVNYRE